MAEKYYWLKLKRDFFKRHDMTIIEGMPNGKDYLLFYLKLLVESLDHAGNLRFSDTIPYSIEMLSTLTHTNVDVVRSAVRMLEELQLIEILDDQTIFMTEVSKMTGCETEWAEKKRIYREKQKEIKEIEEPKPQENQELKDEWLMRSEKIWSDTFALYPKKYAEDKGRIEWEKLVQSRPLIEDRIELAKIIYKAIKLYVEDYKETSPEDTNFKYVPRFDNWMRDMLPVWEKKTREV